MASRVLLAMLAALPGACAGILAEDPAALRLAFDGARTGLLLPSPANPAVPGPSAAASPGAGIGPARPPVSATPIAGGSALGPPPGAAAELLGSRPEAVRRLLGEPSLRRIEGTAEVWLYLGPACALDLVLYPDAGGLSVAHAAARASGTERRTEDACLGELRRRPGAAPAASGG